MYMLLVRFLVKASCTHRRWTQLKQEEHSTAFVTVFFQTDCTRKWYPWHDCRIVEQNEEDVALINQNTEMTCGSGDSFYEEVVRERCDL